MSAAIKRVLGHVREKELGREFAEEDGIRDFAHDVALGRLPDYLARQEKYLRDQNRYSEAEIGDDLAWFGLLPARIASSEAIAIRYIDVFMDGDEGAEWGYVVSTTKHAQRRNRTEKPKTSDALHGRLPLFPTDHPKGDPDELDKAAKKVSAAIDRTLDHEAVQDQLERYREDLDSFFADLQNMGRGLNAPDLILKAADVALSRLEAEDHTRKLPAYTRMVLLIEVIQPDARERHTALNWLANQNDPLCRGGCGEYIFPLGNRGTLDRRSKYCAQGKTCRGRAAKRRSREGRGE